VRQARRGDSTSHRKIADYLAGLDEADAAEPADTPGAAQAAIAASQTRRAELNRLAAKLEDGRGQIEFTMRRLRSGD
jgi:hypothetical protein